MGIFGDIKTATSYKIIYIDYLNVKNFYKRFYDEYKYFANVAEIQFIFVCYTFYKLIIVSTFPF